MTNNKTKQPHTTTTYRTLEQIHQGIQDYFECRLTDEQEEQLRSALVSTRYRTPQIEECIAVMGFKPLSSKSFTEEGDIVFSDSNSMVLSERTGLSYRKSYRAWITVAATILVAILIAVPLLIDNEDSSDISHSDCYAYVGGNKITDEELVMRMLMEDLDEFDQSMTQINDEFDSTMEYLSQIIEENENPL